MKVLDYWQLPGYYQVSEAASQNKIHPAVIAVKRIARTSKKILDMGSGEGTRLAGLKTKGERVGVDISDFAIDKGKKKFKKIKLMKGDIENLPLNSESFDLVYSMFTIEHVESPEKMLRGAFRVLEKGGIFVLAAPNYGAPNRRSPNSIEGKFAKLLKAFKENKKPGLGWKRVVPRGKEYFIDADTQIEPDMSSLIMFMEKVGFKVVQASSLWELDDFSFKQLPFRILGKLGIKPFVFWGPQIFVITKK